MTVLVTRPERAGQELTQSIIKLGGDAIHHPLIAIKLNPAPSLDITYIENCDIVIAVSQHAVHYSEQLFSNLGIHWSTRATYIALVKKLHKN